MELNDDDNKLDFSEYLKMAKEEMKKDEDYNFFFDKFYNLDILDIEERT